MMGGADGPISRGGGGGPHHHCSTFPTPFDSSQYFTLILLLILVIISDQGISYQRTSASSSRQRWAGYETALSNTDVVLGGEGPLGSSSPTGGGNVPVPSLPTTKGTTTTTTSPSVMRSITKTIIIPGPTGSPISHNSNKRHNNNGTTSSPISTGGGSTTRSSSSSYGRASGPMTSYNSNRNNYFGAGRRRIPLPPTHGLLDGFPEGALFENNTSVNITVPVGDTAFLRCRVKNLGERSISWIRRRDWHILTTGKITYTNDGRFNVLHSEGTEDWILQIKFVQERDAGQYECQISLGTGILSFVVNLSVAVPEAFILGNGDEYHVEQGSTINLVCVIEKSPRPPEFVFWYHNDVMINYMSEREVSIKTEPGLRTQSRLTIRDARNGDSGNYTCTTPNAAPASIYVYVSQASGLFSGDKIAAIQRRTNDNSPSSSSSSSSATATSAASSNNIITTTSFFLFSAIRIRITLPLILKMMMMMTS